MRFTQTLFKKIDNQKLLYLAVGAWNTCVGIAVFSILYYLLGRSVHYQLIAVISHILSVLQSWLMYRKFVFKSQSSPFVEYLKFNLSSLVMLGFKC